MITSNADHRGGALFIIFIILKVTLMKYNSYIGSSLA